jgi:hypothetical protein
MAPGGVQISRCRRIPTLPFAQQNQDYHEADVAYYPTHEPYENKCNAQNQSRPNYIQPRSPDLPDMRFRTCPNYISPTDTRNHLHSTEHFADEDFQPIGFERQKKFVEPLESGVRSYAVPGSNIVVYHDVSFWRDVLAIIGIGYIIKLLWELWTAKKN